ncbi:Ankyrin repeat and sterile alpha motif domain-containing protein 1B [Larimichthys crocea]|uniref:Uncharacterized protein n=1 Tax=Larimichthys crocea TaxID=215358 RepID=A0ACD3Q617_LARCR|nr:Ankyrin repeat and sterile alpha motif domain-containing protein 1B [Larimichthys crocea]
MAVERGKEVGGRGRKDRDGQTAEKCMHEMVQKPKTTLELSAEPIRMSSYQMNSDSKLSAEIVASPSLDVFLPEDEDNPYESVTTAVTAQTLLARYQPPVQRLSTQWSPVPCNGE